MKEWGNSIRIGNGVLMKAMDRRAYSETVLSIRNVLIKDISRCVATNKIHNPDVYLWDRQEISDIVLGWYIGDWDTFRKRQEDEKLNIFERLKVNTSDKIRTNGDFKQGAIEKSIKLEAFGEKPDPKTENPYVK